MAAPAWRKGNEGLIFMKVKTMIMASASCFALIPVIASAAVANFLVRQDASEQFRSELIGMASNEVSSLNAVIDKANADVAKLAGFDEITAANSSEATQSAQEYISVFENEDDMIKSVFLVDDEGTVILGSGAGEPLDNFEKYSEYESDALFFNSFSGSASDSAMFIKHELANGTLIINYDISGSKTFLSKLTSNSFFYNNAGALAIVDSSGSWSSGTGINTNLEGRFSQKTAEMIPNLQDGMVTDVIEFSSNSGRYAATMVKVGGENGLTAIVSCSADGIGIFANNVGNITISLAVGLSIVSFVMAIVVSSLITKPLRKIEETLDKIRRGDHEARISNVSNNEYGQMSRAFNNLVDEIVVSEDRYKTISDMSDNIIFEWNFKTNEVVFSNNFNKKFSYRAPSDNFGDSFLLKAKVHPDDADRYRNDLDNLGKGKDFDRNEYRIKNIYGDFIWVLIRTAVLKDSAGNPLKAVGVMVDIDRAKRSEQQLTERASFDALTSLYNRETIESQIDNEISLSAVRKNELAVLFIDVDDFKYFNDTFSHATGDEVLKFLAKTLKECINDLGFVGRYGGDEFIAVIRNAEVNNPAAMAQNIINRLAVGFDSVTIPGQHLSISTSIGISLIKGDYNTRVEYLIGKADDAMYSVKKNGKSNYAFI